MMKIYLILLVFQNHYILIHFKSVTHINPVPPVENKVTRKKETCNQRYDFSLTYMLFN